MIRTDYEGAITTYLAACSDDEVKVVHHFLRRIHNWRREYGPLRIKRDPRDFKHEAAEEAFDALFYLCVDDVQRGHETPAGPFADAVREAIARRG